jgi:spore coat polysaccharide biosynthesis predicted glycosyltransferase SpsG
MTIRADARPAVGYGHQRRAVGIGCALAASRGWRFRYAMLPGADAAPVRRAGGTIVRPEDDSLDALMAVHEPSEGPLLLDGYDLYANDLKTLRRAGYCTVFMDDGCRLGWYPADVVVDGTPGAEHAGYHGPARTRFCLGSAFWPMRSDFRVAREAVDARRGGGMVVAFGGSDPDDQTARVLSIFRGGVARRSVRAILGPGYTGEAFAFVGDRVEVARDPADLAHRMASADLAVCGAGATAVELAFLGVPVVMIVLAENQLAIAEALDRAGAAVNLGDFRTVDDDAIASAVRALARDAPRRAAMAAAGRRLVDGRGLARVARAVVECWTASRAELQAVTTMSGGAELARSRGDARR